MGSHSARLALLLTASVCFACSDSAERGPKRGDMPPVILIVIDTLRADHLGTYGYSLPTSPVLDAFAEQAVVFETNTTQSNSTFPSLTSIFTGLYPKTHRDSLSVPIAGQTQENSQVTPISMILKDAGYSTYGVISHPSWDSGLDAVLYRGWDDLSTIPQADSPSGRVSLANAAYTNKRGFAFLEDYETRDSPLFLWMHYFDPHTDQKVIYRPPEPYWNLFLDEHLNAIGRPELFEELSTRDLDERMIHVEDRFNGKVVGHVRLAVQRALYDGEIAYCDSQLAVFFDRLRQDGLFDPAMIVILSDHGENLEDQELHGPIGTTHTRLYEPVTHVPLMIKLPHQVQGKRVRQLTQSIDVAPTLCDWLGLPAGEAMEGLSLAPLLADADEPLHDAVFAESSDNVEKAWRDESRKYIDRGRKNVKELYNLDNDPEEALNLVEGLNDEERAVYADRIERFRPKDLLRVHVAASKQPYALEIEFEIEGLPILDATGAEGIELDREGGRMRWAGRAGEPIDLWIEPEHLMSEIRWKLAHDRDIPIEECILLGQRPLTETWAIPRYFPGQGPAPSAPRARITNDPNRALIEFYFDAPQTETCVIELRYARPSYAQRLEVFAQSGFERAFRSPSTLFTSTRPVGAFARIALTPEDPKVWVSMQLDGRWPRSDEILWNDRSVAQGEIGVVWPYPADLRLGATLVQTPDLIGVPEGSITLWIASGGAHVGIDTSRLDPERQEALRDLGYVR